jgi:hypothetical protein
MRDTAIQRIYLWYLLLIPQGATFAAIVTYRGPSDSFLPMVFFFAGFTAVAVYAAVAISFFQMPRVWWRALIAILDGPAVLALATLTLHGRRILDLASWFFLSESLSIYLAIAALALFSGRPSRDEKRATLLIVAVSVAVVALVLGWSTWPQLAADWRDALVFGLGLVESTVVTYLVLDRKPVRSDDKNMVPLIVTLVLWGAAVAAGAIVRFNVG